MTTHKRLGTRCDQSAILSPGSVVIPPQGQLGQGSIAGESRGCRLSICVPTFNRAHALGRTLDSLLRQTFKDFEVIVVDDGSSDSTADLVRRIEDPRIRYIRNHSNLGLYQNWNRCLQLAHGEYVAIYHDHDLYDPLIVEQCIGVLSEHPEVSFVFTGVQTIDSAQRIVQTWVENWWPRLTSGKRVARRMARRWSSFIQASTVMVRRESYDRLGGYAVDLGLAADMDMWVRLCSGGDVAYIPEPLVRTPVRVASDYTSQPRWRDVQGLAYIQRSNWARAYAGNWPMRAVGWMWCPMRRDVGYLIFLARAIIRSDAALVQESVGILEKECLALTRWFGWILRKIPIARRVLGALLPAYRAWKKVTCYAVRRALSKARSAL